MAAWGRRPREEWAVAGRRGQAGVAAAGDQSCRSLCRVLGSPSRAHPCEGEVSSSAVQVPMLQMVRMKLGRSERRRHSVLCFLFFGFFLFTQSGIAHSRFHLPLSFVRVSQTRSDTVCAGPGAPEPPGAAQERPRSPGQEDVRPPLKPVLYKRTQAFFVLVNKIATSQGNHGGGRHQMWTA